MKLSQMYLYSGNTKGGNITVLLTSCLTSLELAVWQLTIFVFICKTDKSKPVKQEVNCTVILPPLVFLALPRNPAASSVATLDTPVPI
jgi:hypothetical protein